MWASGCGFVTLGSGATSKGERAASLRGIAVSLGIFVTMSTGTNSASPKSSIAAKMISMPGAIPDGTVWIAITSETTLSESRPY